MPQKRTKKTAPPAAAPSGSSARARRWVAFAAVVVLAVAARILFLLRQTDAQEPFALLFRGDTSAYLGMATSLFGRAPFDQGIPFHPPGVSYFLAAVLWLVGYGPENPAVPGFALKMTMAVVGGLTIGLFFLLIRRLFDRSIALAALPFAVFSFGHYVMSTALNAEVLYLCLVMGVLLGWCALWDGARSEGRSLPQLMGAAGLGILAGLASLVRAEFLLTTLLLTGLAVWLSGRRAVLPALVFVLLCAATLTPWTLRAHQGLAAVNRANADRLPRPLPEWVLVSASGALNFATANNDHASGAFDTRLIDRLVPNRQGQQLDLADPEVNRLFVEGYQVGLEWMLEDPGRAAGLLIRKARLAADALELGYLQGNWPGSVRGDRRPVDLFSSRSGWVPLVQLVLGLAGAWRLFRRRAPGGPHSRMRLLLLPHALTTAAVILAFFGFVRFGMLLVPFVWLLVGAGCLAILEKLPWPEPWRPRGERGLWMLLILLLVIEIAGALSGPHKLTATGTYLPGERRLNPDEIVHINAR